MSPNVLGKGFSGTYTAAFNFNGNNLDITAQGLWKQPSGYGVKTLFSPSANTDGKLPAIRLVTRRPLTPSAEECEHNPRARSAKLRVAVAY